MRFLLFILGIGVGVVCTENRAEAQNYPWCAIYDKLGGTNCGFVTFEQCMETARGLGSLCQPNTQYVEAASMLGCQGTAQFYRVVLPASLPAIFTGLRLGLGFAWVVIVVGEMTGVPTGLGAIIMEARQLSRTEIVICGMVVIGVAGFISDRLVLMLGKRLLRWSPNFA